MSSYVGAMPVRGQLSRLDRIVAAHETYWASVAQQNARSSGMRDFLRRHWDPWYSRWMETRPRLDRRRTSVDATGTLSEQLVPASDATVAAFVREAAGRLSALRQLAAHNLIPTPDLGTARHGVADAEEPRVAYNKVTEDAARSKVFGDEGERNMSAYADNYVGADGQSYPEVAARAVRSVHAQHRSPYYGYIRSGINQKIYLFPLLEDARSWFGQHVQLQPDHDYAAVFSASNLRAPVAGMEHFMRASVSGDTHLGSWLPFLLGLPLGGAGGYFLRRWQEQNPGQALPFVPPGRLPAPKIPPEAMALAPKTSGDPYVGGPWLDMVGQDYGASADVSVGQRPQHLISPTALREEGPGAPIWRLNERLRGFVLEFGNVMSSSEQLWAALRPVWEREVLPFLTEWEPFWRDSSRWSWSEFDRWTTRWNAIVARTATMLQAEAMAPTPKTSDDPYVGGPWLDMVGQDYGYSDDGYSDGYAVGGPWVDLVGQHYSIGCPPDIVGAQADDVSRRRAWPQTRALIQSAISDVTSYAASYPAEAYVWTLDAPARAPYAGRTPGSVVTLEGTTNIVPFSSQGEALKYLREVAQTRPVALAMFERSSQHWPNPVAWRKSDEPDHESVIAQHVASRSTTQTSGTYAGADTVIGAAVDDVRRRAQALADRRAGNVIGVIHTSKDGLWHTLAFRTSDDADDWLGTATHDPSTYTYAAYYDKEDFQWPHPVNEKIGGTRTPSRREPIRREIATSGEWWT